MGEAEESRVQPSVRCAHDGRQERISVIGRAEIARCMADMLGACKEVATWRRSLSHSLDLLQDGREFALATGKLTVCGTENGGVCLYSCNQTRGSLMN